MTLRSLLRSASILALAVGLLASAPLSHAESTAPAAATCNDALTTSAVALELSDVATAANSTPLADSATSTLARPFCITCNCERCCAPYLDQGPLAYSTCVTACRWGCPTP
jgi:hypothetical protein